MAKVFIVCCFLTPPLGTTSGNAAVYSEPFFVTVERVDLKAADGTWVKVIEPDHKYDLITEEPIIQFFNNGRIRPGVYTNVRIITRMEGHPHPVVFDKQEDYLPPIAIAKGSYVRVQFYFDFASGSRVLDEKTIYRVKLTVDEDERADAGSAFSFAKKEEG